ncbi:LOW QUALITY PROTEIN: THAP domain-containing protein 8 [Mergus octosetaceus]
MRQEHWVPTRHQHLCSDHFEPSCFEYRWGVRYLRPDAVPTIFPGPGTPPKRPSPGKPPRTPQPEQPPPDTPTASPTTGTPPGPRSHPTGGRPHPFPPTVEPAPSSVPGGSEEPPPVLAYVETVPELFVAPTPHQPLPHAGGAELSAAELLGVVLLLQRKVKVLQQRHRRHCARLEAMEGCSGICAPPRRPGCSRRPACHRTPPAPSPSSAGEAEDALL